MKIDVRKLDILRLSEQEKRDWNTILQNSDDATIFHTPEWGKLLVEETDADSRVLIAYINNQIVGIFPYYIRKKSLFKYSTSTLIETPYGGPLAINNKYKNIILLKLIKKQERGLFVLSSTINTPPDYDITPLIRLGYKPEKRSTMILDLKKSKEELWKGLSNNSKRMIIKANKNCIIEDCGVSCIEEYHKMLSSTYKRLDIGKPPPINFYKRAFDLHNGKIKLLFMKYNNKRIAGIIIIFFKNTVIFWTGALYEGYSHIASTHLIHWKLIEMAWDNKLSYYNLLHYHDYRGNLLLGLKRFKNGFGAIPTDYFCLQKKSKTYYIIKAVKIVYRIILNLGIDFSRKIFFKKHIRTTKKEWDMICKNSNNLFTEVSRCSEKKELKNIKSDISKKLHLNKKDHLLEIGCGNGLLLSELSKYTKAVTGVDFSLKMIEKAKNIIRKVDFRVAEANNLPFNENFFEKILCYGVFHYFPNKKYARQTIKELIRVCKKNGIIMIGDVTSKKHKHIYEYFRSKRLLKAFSFYNKIKVIFIRYGKNKRMLIRTPEKWLWYDLEWMTKFIESNNCSVKILKQPLNIQWGETTHNHRFDLIIEKH